MFTSLAEDGSAAGTEVFASGWLDQETGVYSGRPVDIAQLRKYRSGERTHEIINIVARTPSDEDIDNLVAYYSGLRITVEAPE
jgi:hypothetical protein